MMYNEDLRYRTVKTLTREQVCPDVTIWVGECFRIYGKNILDAGEVARIADELTDDLTDPYNSLSCLRLAEVERALKDGAKGNLGEYFGISTKSCCGFLRSWQGSEHQRRFRRSIRGMVEPGKRIAEGPKDRYPQTVQDIRNVCEQIRRRDPRMEIFTNTEKYAGRDISESIIVGGFLSAAKRLGMNEEYETIRSYAGIPEYD